MRARQKKAASPKGTQGQMPIAQPYTFVAPVRGLVLNENLAMAQPGGAEVMDNWICTQTGARVRGGTSRHIPLGAQVKAIFSYRSGGAETAFGATDANVYNITTAAGVTPAPVISGQSNGNWSTQQFGTAGGDFMYAVNGANSAQLFDGATWAAVTAVSTPAITGIATTSLAQVFSFANRLFFIEANSLNAWYLPVDSIGGAANSFSLAGIFKRGGKLLYGATWSLDAGDGLDDKCIFVSDQGEVAIYEGTNPGSAADWRLAGVYNVTTPLGPKAKMSAGGDLLIATQSGLVPISAAINRDVAALEMGAVSQAITPLWQKKAFTLGAGNWEIEKWPSENIMIVSQPGDRESTCLIANLQTGAWSRFTGINVQVLGFFDGSVFFGGLDGNIYRFESGGSDNGTPYTSVYLGKAEGMGAHGLQKTIVQMRATFRAKTRIAPQVSAKVDYDLTVSSPPNAGVDSGLGSIWGVSVWGAAKWGGSAVTSTQALWASVGRTGYAIAPEVQVTVGSIAKPNVELVGVDATFHVGAMVT